MSSEVNLKLLFEEVDSLSPEQAKQLIKNILTSVINHLDEDLGSAILDDLDDYDLDPFDGSWGEEGE